jgi:hypothetical protein
MGSGAMWDRLPVVLREHGLSVLRQVLPSLLLASGALASPTRRRLAWGLLAWFFPALLHFAAVAVHGGDYQEWHRYHTPLFVTSAFAMAIGLPALVKRAPKWAERARGRRAKLATASLLVGLSVAVAVWQGAMHELVAAARSKGFVWFGTGRSAMTASRITSHVATADVFSWLSEERPEARLASLENGSIWYFYTGTPVELLGWTDRDIASGPLNPVRKIGAADSRCDLAAWVRHRPEVIWLDTQTLEEAHFRSEAVARAAHPDKAHALMALLTSSRHWWWTRPYFLTPYLLDAYEPRLTIVNDRYRILWLARSDLAAGFDRRLEAAGFRHLR